MLNLVSCCYILWVYWKKVFYAVMASYKLIYFHYQGRLALGDRSRCAVRDKPDWSTMVFEISLENTLLTLSLRCAFKITIDSGVPLSVGGV